MAFWKRWLPGRAPEPGPDYGKRGEDWAEGYLKSLGYEVLERGFRTKAGELDLVARDGQTLVFVEVKARSEDSYGGPAAAVTPRKQVRIAKAAAAWMLKHPERPPCVRFDVVALVLDKVEHIKDAFPSPIRFTF